MKLMQTAVSTTKSGLLPIAILVLSAGCASQGEPAAEATTAMNVTDSGAVVEAAPEEKKSTKLICRRIKPTGSRMTERVCMRPAQWEKYSGQGRTELEKVQRDSLQRNMPGG